MSWSGRGIEDETRERMIEAARRSGMSVGDLVRSLAARSDTSTSRRERRAGDETPPRDDLDRRLEALADRIKRLSSPAEPEPRRSRDRGQETTLAEIAEAVDRLTRQASRDPARVAAPDRAQNDASAILAAIEGLDQRVRALAGERAPRRAAASEAAVDDRIEERVPARRSRSATSDLGRAVAEIDERRAKLDREAAAPRRRGAGADLDRHFRDLTAKIDQIRSRDDRSSTEQIVEEIRALRDIVERRIGSEGEVSAEIVRLTGAIDELASRRPERATLEPLMTEIGRLRDVILQNNVEGSLKSLEAGYGHIVDRLDDLKRGLAGPKIGAKVDTEIAEIRELLRAVPQVAQLSAIERAVGDLTDKVERLAARESDGATAQLERRIAELKVQLEEIDPAPVVRSLDQRLKLFGDKLERIEQASRGPVSPDRMLGLFDELRTLAAGSRTTDQIRNLETRLGELVERIGEIDARRPSQDDTDRLHDRIAELAGKIDRISGPTGDRRTLEALEATIARLDRDDRGLPTADVEALSHEIAEMRRELAQTRSTGDLEAQMRLLAERLERSSGHEPDDEALAQIEDQLGRISQQLALNDDRFREIGTIEATLRGLAERIGSQQTEAVEAARAAAREMVRELGGERGGIGGQETVLRALQDDLRSLQSAARDTETRTNDTLISLHDALTGIVGRLTAIEKIAQTSARAGAARTPSASETRTALLEETAPVRTPTPTIAGRPVEPPITEASVTKRARDLLNAAASEDTRPLEPGSGKPRPAATPAAAPAAAKATAAPAQARPATMASPIGGGFTTAAEAPSAASRKADFIAAARRAAQAAATASAGPAPAVEAGDRPGAGTAGEEGAATGSRLSRIGQVLKAKRRPLVLATAALVLAILTLRLIPGGEPDAPRPVATREAPVAAPQTPVPAVAAVDTAKPAANVTPQPPVPETTPATAAQAPATATPSPPPSAAPSAATALPVPTGQKTSELSAPSPDASMLAPTTTGSVPPATGPATSEVKPAEPAATPSVEAPTLPAQIGSEPLRKAATGGDPRAAFEVGLRFAEGRGIAADAKRAVEWYRRAADQGIVPAQYRLAVALDKGVGTPRDADQAKRLYIAAAEKGNVRAMHNLGVLYANARDMASALPWFQKAADLGLKDSQFNLGIIHALGSGVKQDLAVSYKWFALAAKQGDQEAEKKQADVASHLDKVNLAAARMAVQTWVQRPLDREVNDELRVWAEPKETPKPAATAPNATSISISKVQSLLQARGIYSGPIDGTLSPRTRTAIRTFQKKLGQPQTGEVDGRLLQSLAGSAG